ncbi:helix-hairpin-helix domain-containing protein [Micromonospora robiginosa]|uniref:Helix-hairpin-helix protein n=1 Tax=Micromonospora robiginosa TaxID=2749844 RepID=A0A7L6B2W3_9ACTN
MPSSFGQWLLVILALLIGVGVGWAVFGRRSGADASTPTVEGAAAPATEVTATVDEPRPAAVVDETPAAAAVTDHPGPVEEDSTSRLDADTIDREPVVVTAEPEHTTTPADSKPITGAEPATAPEPIAAEPIPASEPATTSEPATAPEPIAASDPVAAGAAQTDAAAEPERVATVASPAGSSVEPVDATAPSAGPAEPVTVAASDPAEPADAVEPVRTGVAPEPAVGGLAEPEPATAATGTEPVPATTAAVDATPSVDAEPAVDATPAPVGVVAEPATTTDTEPAVTPVVPAPRASAENDAPDDFRRIQGIGPKLAAALQEAGIRTYRQLADLDEAALRETVKAAGLRAAPGLATWPQQAKVLAGARADAERVLPAGAE